MKHQRLTGFIIAVFCFSAGPLTTSAQNFADTLSSFHSSLCEAINPAQSQRMEWREAGLINRDPSRSLWVMCPIPIAFYNTFTQDSYFGIVAGNNSNQSIRLDCILRYWVNQRLTSESQSISISPGGRAEYYWEVFDTQLVSPAVQCNLPPNASITGLIGGANE